VTRVAVECLTVWIEPGQTTRLPAVEHIAGVVHDPDGPGADLIIFGLLNLNELVLLQLVKDRGATAENMRERAGEFLRELSSRLPE
jgi:hypothetical protein